jgi:hypothetical protein
MQRYYLLARSSRGLPNPSSRSVEMFGCVCDCDRTTCCYCGRAPRRVRCRRARMAFRPRGSFSGSHSGSSVVPGSSAASASMANRTRKGRCGVSGQIACVTNTRLGTFLSNGMSVPERTWSRTNQVGTQARPWPASAASATLRCRRSVGGWEASPRQAFSPRSLETPSFGFARRARKRCQCGAQDRPTARAGHAWPDKWARRRLSCAAIRSCASSGRRRHGCCRYGSRDRSRPRSDPHACR